MSRSGSFASCEMTVGAMFSTIKKKVNNWPTMLWWKSHRTWLIASGTTSSQNSSSTWRRWGINIWLRKISSVVWLIMIILWWDCACQNRWDGSVLRLSYFLSSIISGRMKLSNYHQLCINSVSSARQLPAWYAQITREGQMVSGDWSCRIQVTTAYSPKTIVTWAETVSSIFVLLFLLFCYGSD